MKSKGRILSPLEAVNKIRNNNNGQVVLVLQGGGALAPTKAASMKRCMRLESSRIGSSAHRLARSMPR
jgi:hypothetical protein